MNNNQITALAREYAEECAKGFAPADMPNCLKNEAIDILVCNEENMLKWLSHRYCLVEKNKVKDAYMSARKDVKDGYKSKIGGMIAIGEAKETLLESLFPEIRKEVKNERI